MWKFTSCFSFYTHFGFVPCDHSYDLNHCISTHPDKPDNCGNNWEYFEPNHEKKVLWTFRRINLSVESVGVHAWSLSKATCLHVLLWHNFPIGLSLIWVNSIGWGASNQYPKNMIFQRNNTCIWIINIWRDKKKKKSQNYNKMQMPKELLFVLRFYGPVNPMGSCRAWSVYLITRLLGRLSPLSG